MKRTLSPHDLAEAIGASESSVKRWIDHGRIAVELTAGGHRRIPLAEAVRFVRDRRAALVRPAALGLPDPASLGVRGTQVDAPEFAEEAHALFDHLHAGRADAARALVVLLYVTGRSVAAICDGPMRTAMARIGELWKHDPRGVFFEHRATDACVQCIAQLRLLLPLGDTGAAAVGGAVAGDPYVLPSSMAAAVLAGEGYRAVNLGPDTPTEALLQGVDEHRAQFAWLSISSVPDAGEAQRSLAVLAVEMERRGCSLLVGGRALHSVVVPASPRIHVCATLAELASFAKGAASTRAPEGSTSTTPPSQ